MRVLYDLTGASDPCRFSPYGWRIKMALAHKGLAFETVPVRFTDKALIAFSGQDKVPVLRDGEHVVADSWAIAAYLDATYPAQPLFGAEGPLSTIGFVRHWTERVLHAAIMPLIVLDIFDRLDPADRDYFRDTRQARLGCTLEAFAADEAGHRATLKRTLSPLRALLADQLFVAGEAPAFADYIVFGALQWARVASPRDVLEADAVAAWRERMLDLYDRLARRTPAAG